MGTRLLYVLTAVAGSPAGADAALRALRRAAAGEREGCALLLFCDLPDGALPRETGDGDVRRRLQSGAAALAARLPGRVALLLRARAWDDAARAWLGPRQRESPERAVASLLTMGKARSRFEAATVTPGSLMGRYDAALFADAALLCTPDTPGRMLAAMRARGARCAAARVLPPLTDGESALSRLSRAGFSLRPWASMAAARRAGLGLPPVERGALLCGGEALCALSRGEPLPEPILAPGCFFARRDAARLSALLEDAHDAAARAFAAFRRGRPATFPAALAAMQPAAQFLLLFASAAAGRPVLAAAALLAEYPALRNPRLLPGALARLALLPMCAVSALDALLCQLTARSRLIRPHISDAVRGPGGCQAAGAALLLLAARGAGALPQLLPVALMWLGAPVLCPALEAPSRARIPLTQAEAARLAELTRQAARDADASPDTPLRMLACCAACMLGELEPDEAARRAQALLGGMAGRPIGPDDSAARRAPDARALEAHETAALLASAQFFRERMADCDAALRGLPAAIEREALARPLRGEGLLARFLRAALERLPADEALSALRVAGAGDAADALFLPPALLRRLPLREETLPLTHPHAFLAGRATAASHAPHLPAAAARPAAVARPAAAPRFAARSKAVRFAATARTAAQPDAAQHAAVARPDPALRFLALACARLGGPFPALLLRSPAVAPYAPLLAAMG